MKNNNKFFTVLKERWQIYLLIGPFLILFVLMTVLPILSSVVLSFFNYDMVSPLSFSGVENYLRMFIQDDIFWIILKNTFILAILTGPTGFLLSFVLAWMINEFNQGLRTLLSFMFYVPSLVGNALYVWTVIFSSDSYGYMNSILLSLRLITQPKQWFSDSALIVPIVVMIQLWMSMGISFLSNISGLQNINPELFEAGAVYNAARYEKYAFFQCGYADRKRFFNQQYRNNSCGLSYGRICCGYSGFIPYGYRICQV